MNPKFNTVYDFKTFLPGISELQIEVYDYDEVGDDLLGITKIDLENRYFSPTFRDYRN